MSVINTMSDPFLDYTSFFHLPAIPEPPAGPAKSRSFFYKLPKVQIEDVDDDEASTHTFLAPAQSANLMDDFMEEDDDPFDDIEMPLDQDELLATSPVAHVYDNYPQHRPLQEFCNKTAKHATHPGILWQAPFLDEAKVAYSSIQLLLRGKSQGKSGGHYQLDVNPFV